MPKILAIDDINDNLISLKAIIDDAFPGSIVLTSLNGPKGIELAIANNPDVILLDIIMPGMDGFEVCSLLKLDERVRDIPVVFLTALKGDKENRIRALEVGAEGFISKPIDEPELIAQIRAMVKIRAANEQKRDEKERLEKLVEERTRELVQSQAQLKGIFENLQDAYFQVNLSGRFTMISPSAIRMYGFESSDEIIGQPAELFYADPRERNSLISTLHIKGRIEDYVYQGRKKDGTAIWVSMNVQLIRNDDGQIIGTEGVVRDISERIKVEKALSESEAKYRIMVELLPDAVIIHEGGKFVFANAAALKTVGADSFEQLIERPLLDYVHPDFRNESMSRIKEIYSTGQPSKVLEEKFITLNNEEIDVEVIGTPILYMGKPAIQTIIRDITDRKRVEEEVQEVNHRFSELVASTDGIVWEADAKTFNFSFVSKNAERILGYEIEDWFQPGFWANHIFEEDRNNAVQLCVDQTSQGSDHDFEYRFHTKDGRTVWLADFVKVIEEKGKPRWLHGLMVDITERKLALEEQQKTYDLLNKLTEQVPGVFYQYRLYPDGRSAFPFASPGMYEIYEVTPEEVREDASPVFTRLHPDDYNYIVGTITESAQNLTLYHSEFRVILPKQGLRWRLCDAKPELMDDGSILWHGIITDITERKLAEQRLKESQQLFQELFNASPDSIILMDPHDPAIPWSIVDCNDAACKMNGYLREEMIGQSIDFLHVTVETSEDHDTFLKRIKEMGILHTQSFHRHQTGYIFAIEVSTSVVNIGGRELVLGIDRDISERKKLEAEIIAAKVKAEKSEQEIILKNNELMGRNKFIQTVLDQLPIGIALNKIDEGSAIYMNKKFEEIYGWTSDEITSITSFFEQVYPDADYRNKLMEQIMNDIQTGDPDRMHWENIFVTRKDGSKRVINAVNIPLIEQNTMVSTVSDITDLHKSQNDLLAAKDKAEESDRLKSAFLANMSHEIRTPLNSIIGFSELLTDPDFKAADQQAQFAKMIHSSGTNLLAIISDIMDLSKIEAGQIHVNNSRFIVNQLISEIQREYSYKAFEKGIELRLDPASPSVETFLVSDQNRIKQVLVNFVGNSIKFTSKGYIEIGFVIFDDLVQFHVIDTGIGIPKNFHEYVFERFGQVDSSSTRKYGGNGLGLAISKSLVEMLGGKIWMVSEPGKGSAFYFAIPSID